MYYVLQAPGYDVQLLSARILFGSKQLFLRGHQFIQTTYNGQIYITDVGYRNGLLLSAPLETGKIFIQESETFRFAENNGREYMLQKQVLGQWADLYFFTTDPYLPQDFEPHHYYNAFSPASIFTQNCIVSLKTSEGSISLINNTMVTFKHGEKHEQKINSKTACDELLKKDLKINLTDEEIDKIYRFNTSR